MADTLGNAVTDLKLDFLHGDPDKDDGPNFDSGYTGNDDSPSSPPTNVVAAASSMGANFDTFGFTSGYFGDGANGPIAGTANWVFEHLYEFQVTSAAFGANGFTDISQILLTEIHLSSKLNTENNKFVGMIGDPIPSQSPVPEPSTLALFSMGLVGMLGFRRKRSAKIT